MNFTICTILHTALFYWPPKLVLNLGFTRRVDKSLHFLFAKGLKTKSFLVALLLVTGFVLDWTKAYLIYGAQNVRLFTLPFCLETEIRLVAHLSSYHEKAINTLYELA